MTQFIIEVIVDPGKGVKGARRMGDALRQVEGAASKMRNELKRVEGRATRTGNVFKRAGGAASEMRIAFTQAEGSAGRLDRELKDVGTSANKTQNEFKRAGGAAGKMRNQLKSAGSGADKMSGSLKRVRTAAGKMKTELNKTRTSAQKLRSALTRFASIAVVIALFTAGTRALADFSQEMSTVSAITRATGDEFDALREKATQLGITTRFTATQAAEGMTFLARAGFEANEVLAAIQGTLNLAQAGALELGAAADITSNVLTSFRLNIDDTARVVDVLALAANSANTTVQQLGDGLKFVAPIAAGVGVELEEVTAAMAALSNAGLQATLAGTGLRRVISELESPSTKTSRLLGELGLEAKDFQVSSVGLTATLQALADAGVDTGLALEIFGDRGGPAFEVLKSALPDVIEFTSMLQRADGTAQRIAATMDDNLNGSLLALKSALQGVVLEAGEQGATGALRGLFDVTTTGLRALADNIVAAGAAFGILTFGVILLNTSLGASAVTSVAAAGAYITQAIAATVLTFAIGGLTAVATSAAIALKVFLFTNPFVLVIAGATAAFIAVKKLTEGIDEYEKTLKQADAGASSGKTAFGRIGDDIIRVEANLERVTGIIAKQFLATGTASEGALRKAAEYRKELERLNKGSLLLSSALASLGDTLSDVEQKQADLNRAIDTSVKAIEAENLLLQKNSREREIQVALLQEVATLEQKFGEGTVSDAQREQLEAVLRTNQGYRDQAEVFERIRGPQENFRAQLAALDDLLDAGRITQSEFNSELAEMAENLDATDFAALDLDSFLEGIDGVDTEGLRKLLADLRAASADGGFIGPPAPEELPAGLKVETGPLSPGLQLQANLLEQIKGPQQLFIDTQTQLNQLLSDGAISAEEYAIALNSAAIASNDLSTDAGQGLTAGLAQIKNQLLDVSGTVQGALVDSFNEGKNALVDFVKTGELDFSGFVDSILSGIAEIIIQQALLAAFGLGDGGGGGGGFGGLLSSFFGGAGEHGGAAHPGEIRRVGERGPELFAPDTAGQIIPAGETAALLRPQQQAAPVVNVAPPMVNIINVSDPSEIPTGIESPEGEAAVMNVLRRNRGQAKTLIA